MRPFHVTSPDAVPLIRQQGIRPSYLQIPNVGKSRHQVASLTANRDPTGLMSRSPWDGSALDSQAVEGWHRDHPDEPPPSLPNTAGCRLGVQVPEDLDGNLYSMTHQALAAMGFTSQAHVDAFVKLGGGVPCDWFVHLGVLPANDIVAVDRLC